MLVFIRFRTVEPELKDSHLGVLDEVKSNDWDWMIHKLEQLFKSSRFS